MKKNLAAKYDDAAYSKHIIEESFAEYGRELAKQQVEIKPKKSVLTLTNVKEKLETLLSIVNENITTPSMICTTTISTLQHYAKYLYDLADTLKQNIANERLRECPFCRHDASLYWLNDGYERHDHIEIECNYCGCTMTFYDMTEEEAIKEWNTRGYHE